MIDDTEKLKINLRYDSGFDNGGQVLEQLWTPLLIKRRKKKECDLSQKRIIVLTIYTQNMQIKSKQKDAFVETHRHKILKEITAFILKI